VQDGDVADVATLFAALVGSDFNHQGLRSYGPKKSQEVVSWLWETWQHQDPSISVDLFVDRAIRHESSVDAPRKVLQTFFKNARHEENVDVPTAPFGQQLRTVFSIVRDQRLIAEMKAATVTRGELLWDGSKVQHSDFVQLLWENHVNKEGTKDRNPPELRLMNLEAERMSRSSEGSCTACTRIVSVSKVKGFGSHESDDKVSFKLLPAFGHHASILVLCPLSLLQRINKSYMSFSDSSVGTC
jgi:hypothetical protein